MKRILPVMMGVHLALAAAAVSAEEPAQKQIKLAIQSQTLRDALNEWARQTGFQIIAPSSETTTTHVAPSVTGTLSPQAALDRLLDGTSLVYEWLGDNRVAIRERVKPKPSVGSDTMRSADVPLRLASLDDTTQIFAAVVPNEWRAPNDSTADADTIDQVIVAGSRLRREGVDGPAPVVIFDRSKIAALGVSTVADVLDHLPQQPAAQHEGVTNAGGRSVRLRGLGLGTTLVLINGRRTVASALQGSFNYFDLNTVPLAAVERVEVLSGSASALYGGDAVGGVVNIVLRSRVDGPTIDLYFGSNDGGGRERRASLVGGYATDRFRSVVNLDAMDRDFLFGAERSLYVDQDYRRFGSIDRRSTLARPGNITSRTTANLPGLPSRFAAVPQGFTGTPSVNTFASTAGQRNLVSLNRYSSVVPETERFSGSTMLEYEFARWITGFGELLYTQNEGARQLFPPFIAGAVVPATNPFNPFGVAVAADALLTDVGPRRSEDRSESMRYVAGFKGRLAAWDWEAAYLGLNDDASNWEVNALDPASLSAALAVTDPNRSLNLFHDGPAASPDVLASLIAPKVENNLSSRAQQGSVMLRGPIFTVPGGAVEGVIGGEVRNESLHFELLPRVVVDADRDTSAAFAELRVPLVSPRMTVPLVNRLVLTAAGRWDSYSDFGDTFNPQYGVEWNPVASLLLRASYGDSFRPPSLFDLYSPRTTTASTIADPRRNNETVAYQLSSGGNPSLNPEEGDSINAGFVFTLGDFHQLRFGANYWRIKLDDRTQPLTATVILANESMFPTRVARAAPTAADLAAGLPGRLLSLDRTSVNFGAADTHGIDVEFSQSFDTDVGRFSPSLFVTRVSKYEVADVPNVPPVDRVGIANSQGTIPEWKGNATLAWNLNGFSIVTSLRYVSDYDDVATANIPNGRTIPSTTFVDVQLSLDLGAGFRAHAPWLGGTVIRVGAINLFDKGPHFAEVGSTFGYDTSQADARQRLAYMYVSKSF